MGKKGGTKNEPNKRPMSHSSISLREETTGKLQTKGGSCNPKSLSKLEHLQKLALWASREASISCLAAFFGHQFATAGEAFGVPPDPSLFPCQRCETILQPGFNCTVRIEKTQSKARRRHKKHNILTQNTVVYKCHFCSHRNQKRGTPKGHMKEICPSKAKQPAKSEHSKSMLQKCAGLQNSTGSKDEIIKIGGIALPAISGDTSIPDSPATPLARSGTTLLDAKKRKRNRSGSKKPAESESSSAAVDAGTTVSASSKRKRKSWTSLKEIVESKEHDSSQNIINLTIPMFM